MTVIHLPDDQAAALTAKAAAQGLSLADWLGELAGIETTPASQGHKGRYSLAELLSQCDPTAELTAEDRAWLDASVRLLCYRQELDFPTF